MKTIKIIILAQLALIGILLSISAPAWANLAANTQIINQAQLSYFDGLTTKTATASVTVTVSLVASAPTIVPGPAQSTSYNGSGTTLTDSFTITSTANGPDTYNLSAAVTGSTNTTGPTVVPTAPNVVLGASVTTIGSTAQVIVVPADGTSNSSVNGIEVGDTVVINGESKTVTGISDNASGTSTITLNSALVGGAPGAGVLVAEKKTITTTVTAGTITSSGTDVTVSANITATSATTPGATATSASILNTFTSGVATLTKYVRNVTVPSGTGSPYTYGGNNYYLTSVTAKPGDVLEYLLVATNSGAGSVSASVVTDVVPTRYVSLKTGVYSSGTRDVTYVNDAGAASYLTSVPDSDAATYAAPTLTVNVGTGATNSAGGTIPGGNKSVLVLYQVTVNP